jgi:hypothetical protein
MKKQILLSIAMPCVAMFLYAQQQQNDRIEVLQDSEAV